MMYCENCHKFFEDVEAVRIYDDPSPSGVSLASGQIVIDESCPYCGSSFTDEASKCECCGAYIPTDGTLCEDCEEVAEGLFRTIKNEIARRAKNESSMDIMNDGIRDYLINRIEYLFS